MLPSYAILIFAIWAALRFNFRVTTSVVMVANIAAIIGSIRHLPTSDPVAASIYILHLQILMSSVSAISLLLSAATRHQQEITDSLSRTIDKFLASEERLNIAIEAAHLGTWSWEIPTGKVTWSENVEEIFGCAKGTFAGTYDSFFELIYPEDRPKVQKAISDTMAGKTPSYSIEHRISWADGSLQ